MSTVNRTCILGFLRGVVLCLDNGRALELARGGYTGCKERKGRSLYILLSFQDGMYRSCLTMKMCLQCVTMCPIIDPRPPDSSFHVMFEFRPFLSCLCD